MKLRRKLGVLAITAVMGASLAVVAAGTASAAGRPGKLEVVGPCGDLLDLIERVAGTIIVDITVPSSDASETWSLTAFEQEFGPTTGARVGAPVNLVPNPLPQLAFSPAEGGFTTTMNFTDTPGATHGFFYTATRTLPTPETCTSQGFFTNPGGGVVGPVQANPVGRPDSSPVPTNVNEADRATHVVSMQFDQEMQAGAQGIPVASRFSATVNGVNRAVTGVTVSNDNPPNKAVVSVTLGGALLPAGAAVSVSYRQPLSSSDPQLEDLEANLVSSFTQNVTVF